MEGPAEAAGERLDRFLATHLGSLSAAERAVEAGALVDGIARPKSYRLPGGGGGGGGRAGRGRGGAGRGGPAAAGAALRLAGRALARRRQAGRPRRAPGA